MPQRNDDEGGNQPSLSFSPATSVWGQMGRAWRKDKRNTSRTTDVQLRQSLWRTKLPSYISISVSPTSRSSPLLRRNAADDRDTSWAGRVDGPCKLLLCHARNRYGAHDHVLRERECVFFIGTQFSNLYTSVDTPVEAAWLCVWCLCVWCLFVIMCSDILGSLSL
jgi:hypothetical protein